MRIFPLALIAVGAVGVLKHFGLIDAAMLPLLWPLGLIGLGVAMLVRGPRWRARWQAQRPDRWERRMHRHFGPGWAHLSEAERERFRAGMRQGCGPWDGPAPDGRADAAGLASSRTTAAPSEAPPEPPKAPGTGGPA